MDIINKIIIYWFGYLDDKKPIKIDSKVSKRWFMKDPDFDAEIKEKFEANIIKARAGEYKQWEQTAKGKLALIILFDQFCRNVYRDTPQAFENDKIALDLCFRAITDKNDEELLLIYRYFLYMPMMHAEDLQIQNKSIEYFSKLVSLAWNEDNPNIEMFKNALIYAKKHQEIVEMFGRFPHRNKILGRETTLEESGFLKLTGSSF